MIYKYGHEGKIECARQLFDKMPVRDVVSWTALVSLYCKVGKIDYARQVFDEMPQKNLVSWNSMLSGYVNNGRLSDAQDLFNMMQERDVYSWTLMLSGYRKMGMPNDARRVFDQMPEKNVVSWTTMIAVYCENLQVESARELFDRMPEKTEVSWTTMLSGYARIGRMEDAHNLFGEMIPRLRSVECYNSMIAGYVKLGRMEEAWDLFVGMPIRSLVSWNTMVDGFTKVGQIESALQLFGQMPERNTVSWTVMIYGLCVNGRIDEARMMFDRMIRKNTVSWNAMISGYQHNGQSMKALNLVKNMKHSVNKWNQSTVASALSACGSLALLGTGKQIHKEATVMGFCSDCYVGSSLIDMYAKCGCIDSAFKSFAAINRPDLVVWNSIIMGLAQNCHERTALDIYSKMRLDGTRPNHITFLGVLYACNHAGLAEAGLGHFTSMSRDEGIKPRSEHYVCIVDVLGRSGRIEEAHGFIKLMPIEADVNVWGALLSACRNHGSLEFASFVAERILQLGSENPGNYILVSDFYASCGRWGDVDKVREKMRERGMVMEAGCSWIEVRGEIHKFVVGEGVHPCLVEIYGALDGLAKVMDYGWQKQSSLAQVSHEATNKSSGY